MKKCKLLLMLLISMILISCIMVTPRNSIKRLIDKYPQIISVTECWGFGDDDYNSSDILFNSWVSLDIKMKNEKRIFISYIRSSNLKSPFHINLLGESTFEIQHLSGSKTNHWVGFPIDFISKNINVQLKSVDDVIDNYDLIHNFTNSLTKLADIEILLDIDQKEKIIKGLEYSYSLGSSWWRNYIQPIIMDEDKWYILNITHDEVPNDYKFKEIETATERERRYIHNRNGVIK
jgi:hypothetical protein